MEISRVAIFEEIWKTVQEAWFGKGKVELNNVSRSVSLLHVHLGSEPNDRDGMSVMELSTPAIWSGVRGEAFASCSRSASARTSWIATLECLAARRCTQWTVGELSLNNATCAFFNTGQTVSMTSHNIRRPAISRSEFVMVPRGFLSVTMLDVMSSGHWRQKTVGVTPLFSPRITPPRPDPEASVMPM